MNTDPVHELRVDWRQLDAEVLHGAAPAPGRSVSDRSHAIFAIQAYLQALGLHGWIDRFIQWLGRYDGLEQYVEPEDEPLICVRNVLHRHVCEVRKWVSEKRSCSVAADLLQQLKRRIVDDLLELNFVRYAAFLGNEPVPDGRRPRWQPLRQGWLEFMEVRQAGEQLWIWQRSDGPNPSRAALRDYLLHEP